MLSAIFQSVFSQANVAINPIWFLTSLLVSLALGWVLAKLYRSQTPSSRDFAMTLVVLPSLIAVIIFLVNGNLGTSVAVAGAFSLIKFRSPASSSKELLLVFMATALGLATGMGYLLLAILMTLLVTGVLAVLERVWTQQKTGQPQQVTVSLPQTSDSRQHLEAFLEQLGTSPLLEKVTVKQGRLELTYLLLLNLSDQELLDRLQALDPNWTISLSRTAKKKKSL